MLGRAPRRLGRWAAPPAIMFLFSPTIGFELGYEIAAPVSVQFLRRPHQLLIVGPVMGVRFGF